MGNDSHASALDQITSELASNTVLVAKTPELVKDSNKASI